MISDIKIYESGQGGEFLLKSNDLATILGYENAPYLSMFGGDDWWANYTTDNPFQSKTEQVLRNTPLTSGGRILIEDAVKTDLSFLDNIPGTTWSVVVTITAPNRVDITITINGQVFNFMWNPDGEIAPAPNVAPVPPVTTGLILSLFSSYGVITSGADVSTWSDLSGNGNHFTPFDGPPTLTNSVFGAEPGVSFASVQNLRKLSFTGLAGNPATTIFLVVRPNATPVGNYLEYRAGGGTINDGEFELYDDGFFDLACGIAARGNVGSNNGFIEVPGDANYVFTATIDYTKPSPDEIAVLVNNSDSGFTILASSNNTGTFSATNMLLGDTACVMGCVLVYNRNLTDSEKTLVNAYLADKFSI